MDDELIRWLYHRLLHDPRFNHTRDCTFCDGLITLIYFFGVIKNRSLLWASDKRNWPLWCRRLVFPSYSELMRRLKTPSVQAIIDTINNERRSRLPNRSDKSSDGKPLLVGGYSKDPDARSGKIPDGWGRGYKLHAIADDGGAIDICEVTALDGGEATVLRQMLKKIPLQGVIVRTDANYDSNPTYEAAAEVGARLVAPRRKPGTGLGHRAHHPHRLAAIAELEQSPQGLAAHKRHRNRIEQSFAHLTNLPFGLWALPNFVRRLHRVRMWIKAKVALYHLYKSLMLTATAAA